MSTAATVRVVDELAHLLAEQAAPDVPCEWVGSLGEQQARRVLQQHLACAGPPFGCVARNLACEVLARAYTKTGRALLVLDTRHASPWEALLMPGSEAVA
jgi:hypothetical protein